MPEILQLKDFVITRLHVDWHEPDKPTAESPEFTGSMGFDYEVLRRTDTARFFALRFQFKLTPEVKKTKTGYEIEAEIVGFFDFPGTMTEDKMQALVRINGATILYGILRGEIAAFTGSFPGGKFMLPAVYMQDIVKDIETRKRAVHRKVPLKESVSRRKRTSS